MMTRRRHPSLESLKMALLAQVTILGGLNRWGFDLFDLIVLRTTRSTGRFDGATESEIDHSPESWSPVTPMCWLSAGPQTSREQPPPNRFKDPYVDIDAGNQPCLRLQLDVGTPDLVALSRPTFPGRRRFVATAGLINKYMESLTLHGLANLSHSMLWWHRPWPNLGGSGRRRQDCEQDAVLWRGTRLHSQELCDATRTCATSICYRGSMSCSMMRCASIDEG